MIWRILGIIGGAYFVDVYLREQLVGRKAQQVAEKLGKGLLNVGAGTSKSSLTGAKFRGVSCDIAADKDTPCGPTTMCYCDVMDLSKFGDKQFGVALAANVLRYVPDRKKAEKELKVIQFMPYLS